MIDDLLGLVHQVEPKTALKYNKHYIGLSIAGTPSNFVSFVPRKAHVIMNFKLTKTAERDESLKASAIETLSYDSQFGQYRIRVDSTLDSSQRGILLGMAADAWETYRK